MTVDPDKLLQCAIAAATAAGNHALKHCRRRREIVKRAAHDVKLKLDLESQAKATECIRASFPDHSILGEEDEARSRECPAGEVQWVIDPIDGTVNFTHGLPLWCSSVAAAVGDEVVAGAVFAPVLDELYTAQAGAVSLCNGDPIRVSDVPRLSEAIIATGLDHNEDGRIPPFAQFRAIASRAQKTRVMGSAALDMCYTARGFAEGYFEGRIFLWDVAAAGFIVKQAGGRSELLRKSADGVLSYMATNGHIHEELRQVVAEFLPA